jgi:hypothetical protein
MENITALGYKRKHIKRHPLMELDRGPHPDTVKRFGKTGLTQDDFDIANLRRRARAHLRIWTKKLDWEATAKKTLGYVPKLSLRKLAKLAKSDIRTVKAALRQSYNDVRCQAVEAFRSSVIVLNKNIKDLRAAPILFLQRQKEAATRKAESSRLAWEFQSTLGKGTDGLSRVMKGLCKVRFLRRRQSPKLWLEELDSIKRSWKWDKRKKKMDKPPDEYHTPNQDVKETKHPASGLPASFARVRPLTARQQEEIEDSIARGWAKREDVPSVQVAPPTEPRPDFYNALPDYLKKLSRFKPKINPSLPPDSC